uniref:Wsv025-like protein n=1 Tax=Sicyonia whispovirus TaxID=2984283 RepID=A0A9C7C740_9VIRU|nr:MAG: wsv025-like protein [Sicyonia whispovirus]
MQFSAPDTRCREMDATERRAAWSRTVAESRLHQQRLCRSWARALDLTPESDPEQRHQQQQESASEKGKAGSGSGSRSRLGSRSRCTELDTEAHANEGVSGTKTDSSKWENEEAAGSALCCLLSLARSFRPKPRRGAGRTSPRGPGTAKRGKKQPHQERKKKKKKKKGTFARYLGAMTPMQRLSFVAACIAMGIKVAAIVITLLVA